VTVEGGGCLLPQNSVLATLGFSPVRVFPKDARFQVAATSNLRAHRLPTLVNRKLPDLSVQIFLAGEGYAPADGMLSWK